MSPYSSVYFVICLQQVTDFKYLEYRISEYKSDLEDKIMQMYLISL